MQSKAVDSVMTTMTEAKFRRRPGRRHGVPGPGNAARDNKKLSIIPRLLQLPILSQRLGAEQAAQCSDHHPGWRLAQNPGCAFTQQD